MGIRIEMCPLSWAHLKNTAILLLARTYRRRKRHIYRQILPSFGWKFYLFEHKFTLLTDSYSFSRTVETVRLSWIITRKEYGFFSCCRIQHVSYEGKHGSMACKCWKCVLWSALGLVRGMMHCEERAVGKRGHSLWNGLEPHELWRNRRYQMKFSSSFVLSYPRSEVRRRLLVAGINKTSCYLFSAMSMWRQLRHLNFLFLLSLTSKLEDSSVIVATKLRAGRSVSLPSIPCRDKTFVSPVNIWNGSGPTQTPI